MMSKNVCFYCAACWGVGAAWWIPFGLMTGHAVATFVGMFCAVTSALFWSMANERR